MRNDLLQQALAWLAEDPDPQTRTELEHLIASGDPRAATELADRFAGPLQFGTAGLRGELGAGPNRMNRAVVIRAAAGLARYLTAASALPSAGPDRGPAAALVVIGYDARHKSAEFAQATAAVMVGAGLRAAILPRPLPTPVLAFAIRHLGAVAGVMVTASHNPPRDNGYKVYLGDGVQIAPPADRQIAAEIARVGALAELPLAKGGWAVLDDTIVDAYLTRTVRVVTPGSPRDVSVVYTPLHGVGRAILTAAFARAGFPAPTVVSEQAEPDPDFPTVGFPNPEEPGAMDLAFACASSEGPDVVIANDPDADRCAVAVPDPAAARGRSGAGWRMLRGDEVGTLLATQLISKYAKGTFATTIVSSTLLSRIAAAAGLPYRETLTGFKWIARTPNLRYGYEEAIGYCADPATVRDKDGISAALLIAELVATLKQQGRTLTDLLDDLALEYGLHATDQLAVRVSDPTEIAKAMARLREQPPTRLAQLPVSSVDDLRAGSPDLPPTDALRYRLSAGDAGSAVDGVESARVIIRPSGTEPKLKCYFEVVIPVTSGRLLTTAREVAARTLATLKADLATAIGL